MTGFDPVDQSSNLCITSPLFSFLYPKEKAPSHSGIAAVYGTVVPGFDSQRGLFCIFATVEKWSFRQAVILKSRVRFSAVALFPIFLLLSRVASPHFPKSNLSLNELFTLQQNKN